MKKQLRESCGPGRAPRLRPIAFALVPPLLSLAFSGCVNMAELQKPSKEKGVSLISESVSAPISRIQGAVDQKEVLNAIRDMELVSASSIVFNFLKSDVPVEDKYNVVNAFAFKYSETGPTFGHGTGNPALDELVFHATRTFSTDFSMSLAELKENEPERLSYMQALAYGVAKSGYPGFRAALGMLAQMDISRNNFMFPGLSKRDISLAGPFANMVCISMVKSGKLDTKKAISDLTELLGNDTISAHTKSAMLNLVKIIDPLAFPGLLKNPNLSGATKKQVEAAANSAMKSSRIPQKTRDGLRKRLSEAAR